MPGKQDPYPSESIAGAGSLGSLLADLSLFLSLCMYLCGQVLVTLNFPGGRVTDCCELHDVDPGHQTPVL